MAENPMNGLDARDPTKLWSRSLGTITPSDVADLSVFARGIWVGTAGDIKVSLVDDPANHTGIVIPNVPVGILPVAVRRVWATGTTAGSLRAFA